MMRFGFREAIFLVLLLAMPVAAYFFVFKPRNTQIAEAREEVRKKQDKLKQLESATRSLDDLGREIDKLGSAIELFEHKLPAQREEQIILRQVWETAARHHLIPKSVRTDKSLPTANYSELPIKMNIQGDFDGFYSFLLDVERLPRITRMPQMYLKKANANAANASNASTETAQLEAEIVLSIFFDPADSAPRDQTPRKDRS